MKDCNLIATIPAMIDLQKVESIISNAFVFGVRFNTGIVTPYGEYKTLSILKKLCEKYHKPLWVDIKGRQLRVTKWTNTMNNSIKLNHNIIVNGSAKAILRGEGILDVVAAERNEIYVSPLPKHCVGEGQSVNIIGDVEIDGYLTEKDSAYLSACFALNINNIMVSFVEKLDDIAEIRVLHPNAEIVCKIESQKGVDLLPSLCGYNLMAARDDLYIELGYSYKTLYVLQNIVNSDKNAICASRIFSTLEHNQYPLLCDYEDLEMMYSMGYRLFMLCDNICNYAFDDAIHAWRDFLYEGQL